MLLLCFTIRLTHKLSYVNNKMKERCKYEQSRDKRKNHCSRLKIWQVAYEFGCTDGNFSRKLRRDFSEADTEKVLSIIEKLKTE